jgi:tRNA 2-selenouridine synthase
LTLADGLMEAHYDPRYAKHRARVTVPVTSVGADSLDAPDALADRVAAAVRGIAGT